jgi:DNA-binding transcriptional regulator YhcF (GntR family)
VEPTLDIALDREGEIPLGVQLAWALRARILAGDLPRGFRLPGARELAVATAVNANTVRAVYARLEAEGVVATEHGRGTFVTRTSGADGGELAKIAQRAARAARDAGLDPRAVAAALFVSPEPAAAGPARSDGARRRTLREEIAALERRLADARHQRRLAAHADDPLATPPPRAQPGRLLTAAELESIRDELAERLALLEDAERVAVDPAPDQAQHSTAPRAKVTLAPSAPRWRLGHS